MIKRPAKFLSKEFNACVKAAPMHTVLAIVPLTIAGASMLLIPGNLLGVAVIAYPYLAIAAIRAFKKHPNRVYL